MVLTKSSCVRSQTFPKMMLDCSTLQASHLICFDLCSSRANLGFNGAFGESFSPQSEISNFVLCQNRLGVKEKMPLASSKLKWCVLCRVSVSQNFVFHHYPVCLAALIFDWSYFILSTCWKLFHNFLCQFSTFFIVIFKPYTIISIYRQDVKRIRCFSHPAPISRIATC